LSAKSNAVKNLAGNKGQIAAIRVYDAQTRMIQNKTSKSYYRRRCGRPALRNAAIPPCRFIFRAFGRAGMPFDRRHCSLRELRGPCVLIFLGIDDDDGVPSRSIVSTAAAVCFVEEDALSCITSSSPPSPTPSSPDTSSADELSFVRNATSFALSLCRRAASTAA